MSTIETRSPGYNEASINKFAAWVGMERLNWRRTKERDSRRGKSISRGKMKKQLEQDGMDLAKTLRFKDLELPGIEESPVVHLSLTANQFALELVGERLRHDITDFRAFSKYLDGDDLYGTDVTRGRIYAAETEDEVADAIHYVTARTVSYALEQRMVADTDAFRVHMVEAIDRIHGETQTRSGLPPFIELDR